MELHEDIVRSIVESLEPNEFYICVAMKGFDQLQGVILVGECARAQLAIHHAAIFQLLTGAC